MKAATFFFVLCFCGLTRVLFSPIALAAEPRAWEISGPYQSNPLKRATLAGSAMVGGAVGHAWLVVSCRPGAGLWAALRVDGVLAGRFPVDDFEGPGGVGESSRLLKVAMGNNGLERSFFSSGTRQENDIFEWSFALPPSETRCWLDEAGRGLRIFVQRPGAADEPLEAVFILPEQAQPLRELVMPCMPCRGYLK